jgi:hypothetical protein
MERGWRKWIVVMVCSSGGLVSRAQSQFQPDCGGIAVERIDLSRQLGPTRCQGPDGICYAYSAVAAVEAALYRSDGKLRSFDERFAAILSSIDSRETARRFDGVKYGTEDEKTFDGGYPSAVVDAIKRNQMAVERGSHGVSSIWNSIQVARDQAKSVKPESGDVYTGEMFAKDMRLLIKHTPIRMVAETDQKKLGELEVRSVSARRNFATPLLPTEAAFAIGPQCQWTGPNGDRWQRLARDLTRALCDGLPIATGFYTNAMWTASGSEAPRRREPTRAHAAHSNLITGLKRMDFSDSRGPQWVFEMRESWGEGSSAAPKGSVSYLPFDELCRLFSADVVAGPWDKDAMRSKGADSERRCKVEGQTVVCGDLEFSPELSATTENSTPKTSTKKHGH